MADTTDEDFKRLVSVNMRSLFQVTKAVVPLMPARGRIINIGTAAAPMAPGPPARSWTRAAARSSEIASTG